MSKRQHCPGCHGTHNQWYPGGYSKEPCPGLPASSFRVLPPRPPNVAALLDEDASLPAAEVRGALLLVKDMLEQFWEHGGDVDGFDLQDSALKFGILVETKYDPALHGEGEDAEPGDPWYVFSPQFEAALDRKEP